MALSATLFSPRSDLDQRSWTLALGVLGYSVEQFEADRIPEAATPLESSLVVIHDPAGLASGLQSILAFLEGYEGQIIVRHRDLPWQLRLEESSAYPLLKNLRSAIHATTNLRSRRELEARGYANVTTIHDAFELDPTLGDRSKARAHMGFGVDDIVLLQPTRATASKNFAGSVRYVNEIAKFIRNRPVRLWIKGPVEESYAKMFAKLLAACDVEVTVGEAESAADAYAACDAVIFPPSWDCFGDIVFEAVAHRRACISNNYPALAELTAGGIRVLPLDEPKWLVKFLAQSETKKMQHLEATARKAKVSFAINDLPARIGSVIHMATP